VFTTVRERDAVCCHRDNATVLTATTGRISGFNLLFRTGSGFLSASYLNQILGRGDRFENFSKGRTHRIGCRRGVAYQLEFVHLGEQLRIDSDECPGSRSADCPLDQTAGITKPTTADWLTLTCLRRRKLEAEEASATAVEEVVADRVEDLDRSQDSR
jgi:hypothetical protein